MADQVEALGFHVMRAMAGLDFAFLGAEKPVNAARAAAEVAVGALNEFREDPSLLFDAPDPQVMEDLEVAMARYAEERTLEGLA